MLIQAYKKNAYKFAVLAASLFGLLQLNSCNKEYEFEETKIAVFADNQLTNTLTSGLTANSIMYFRNHLSLAKEENVDVIVIDGDLVNAGVESFYQNANGILQEVYGEDESKYPEFVYTMGNHEWWTENETVEPNAVKLFKRYARINTPCLVKESTATSSVEQTEKKLADYYKVVNGIPFISISSVNCSGLISSEEEIELKSWLEEIKKLPSVINGGPIFVSYHYAINDLTYSFGQGGVQSSDYIKSIFEDYPQVILFSGDTHFSGINERSINQVNFTNINIGSSCYSRHVSRSCIMKSSQTYYNTTGSSKDTLSGTSGEIINQTPHIQLITVKKNGDTQIDRYFSTNNPSKPDKVGLTWDLPSHPSKENFQYTKKRYQNTEWANKMYGADGLSFESGHTFSVTDTGSCVSVTFQDIKDYKWCEYYRIEVQKDNKTKHFDFVSTYFRNSPTPNTNSFEIAKVDLPEGNNLKYKITAYDFFGNPSLNSLSN